MQRITISCLAIAAISIASAQNSENLKPIVPSTSSTVSGVSANQDAFGSGSLTFTNANGTVYSAAQLESQLSQLQEVLQQTLPMLAAFNQNATASGHKGWEGTLSDLLSRRKNSNSSTSPTMSNVVGFVQKLIPANSTNGVAAVDPTVLKQLQTLQGQLEPVPGLLQPLNLPATAPARTIGYSARTNIFLTPTGR